MVNWILEIRILGQHLPIALRCEYQSIMYLRNNTVTQRMWHKVNSWVDLKLVWIKIFHSSWSIYLSIYLSKYKYSHTSSYSVCSNQWDNQSKRRKTLFQSTVLRLEIILVSHGLGKYVFWGLIMHNHLLNLMVEYSEIHNYKSSVI